MKKLTFTLFAVLAITFNVIAQAPMTINYQAIVRDANNFLMTDREIGMRVSILYGSEDGEAVYVETHRPTVSRYGMISIEIGSGQHVSGDWAINWQSGAFFLKTEYDIGNGTIGYTVSATSKLLAVPVALFSHSSSRLTGPAWELAGFYEGPYSDGYNGHEDGTNQTGIASVYIPVSNSKEFLLMFVKDSNYKIERHYYTGDESGAYNEKTLGYWGLFDDFEITRNFSGTITNENPLTFSFPDILIKNYDDVGYKTLKFSGTLVDGVLKLIFSGEDTIEFNLKKKG